MDRLDAQMLRLQHKAVVKEEENKGRQKKASASAKSTPVATMDVEAISKDFEEKASAGATDNK